MARTDLDVRPVAGRIGAEITGVDLATDLADGVVAEIRAALLAHQVVFFRGQDLDPESQVRFARRFGELTLAHPTQPSVAGHPHVLDVTYPPGGPRANQWHTDVTFIERPPFGSILRSLVVPPYGGDTLWANTVAAYEHLPAELRRLADELWAVHSNEFDYSVITPDPVEQQKFARSFASAVFLTEHPVVRVHPETGAPALLLGGFAKQLRGFSTSDSRRVIELLQSHVTTIENTVRWRWAPGDVAFWDNRATQHYGVADYGDLPRRHHRITLAGERPVSVDGQVGAALQGDASEFTPVT